MLTQYFVASLWAALPAADTVQFSLTGSVADKGRRLLARHLGPMALGLAVAVGAGPACGADFPTRTIRIVVDAPPGAVNDIFARQIGRHLSEALGQPVVIDNRAGASGVLAAEEVLKAAPDGYTVLFGGMTPLIVFPAAGGRIRYDPKSGFIPTAAAQLGYPLIAVSSRLEARSVDGLAAFARSAAAPLTCGTNGNGSSNHFACAVLSRALGIKVTMVPYKGTTFAMQDVVAGNIDIVPAYSSELAPLLGKV